MSIPSAEDDILSTKELANLLGRELVQAKGRIRDLEKQLQDGEKILKQLRENQPDQPTSNTLSELRQEVGRYKGTEAKLQHKIKSLQGQVSKQLDKDKKIKSLEAQVKNLRSQQDVARDEAKRSKLMYIEEKRTRKELSKTLEGKDKSAGWDYILSTIAALPLCSARPEHRVLAPVAKKGVQLCEYLRSDPRTEKFADAILFMPGRMTWCPSDRGYHHALAFGPTHIFGIQSRRWEKNSAFEPLFGKILELFFQEKNDVLYAGTYKCLRLESSIIDSWPDPETEGLLPYNMAETALSYDFSNAPSSTAHKGTISKLYRDGVLRLECMGLRCIGFEKEFYENLVARHHSNLPLKEKRTSETQTGIRDRANKKRRI